MSLTEREIIPSSGALKVKHQLALYVTHFLILSSRLFAICYFTVSYKWWVVALLMFHSCVVLMATFIQNRDKVDCDNYYNFSTIFFMGIHSNIWLCRIIGSCRSNWYNHECVFLTYFVRISKSLYDTHVLFLLSSQRLVLFTCQCVFLCSVFLAPQWEFHYSFGQGRKLPVVYQPRVAVM